jgi:hypothetical protein
MIGLVPAIRFVCQYYCVLLSEMTGTRPAMP